MIKCFLDDGAFLPAKAHAEDGGFDLRTPIDCVVPGADTNGPGTALIDTGIHVLIPKGFVGLLTTKSGLNIKHSLMTEGTIDAGYTGAIKVKVFNFKTTPKEFKKGDKITQLVIMPIHSENQMEQVYTLPKTERGNAGFGSTGR